MTTVVGLDASLTGFGVARIWGAPEFTPLVTTRRFSTAAAGDGLTDRAARLAGLAADVIAAATVTQPDLVLIERPAYSSNTGSVTDRAGLWWFVVARLIRAYHVPVIDVVNNHLKTYATGKGNAGKDAVLAETARRYAAVAPDLADNNEADALILAAMGWHHLTAAPVIGDLPQTHTRALTAVKWPTTHQ